MYLTLNRTYRYHKLYIFCLANTISAVYSRKLETRDTVHLRAIGYVAQIFTLTLILRQNLRVILKTIIDLECIQGSKCPGWRGRDQGELLTLAKISALYTRVRYTELTLTLMPGTTPFCWRCLTKETPSSAF